LIIKGGESLKLKEGIPGGRKKHIKESTKANEGDKKRKDPQKKKMEKKETEKPLKKQLIILIRRGKDS